MGLCVQCQEAPSALAAHVTGGSSSGILAPMAGRSRRILGASGGALSRSVASPRMRRRRLPPARSRCEQFGRIADGALTAVVWAVALPSDSDTCANVRPRPEVTANRD